jgi:predicted RNA-binding protein YlxR (DUF448 family)
MTRGGRARDRDEPERRCIVTGDRAPKAGLIRFVIGPDGAVVPDVLGRLPGRGIYVSADREALDKAGRKGLFARAARAPVTVPPDLPALVEALLVGRVTSLIALARKAGQAVTGREKVLDWLARGEAAVLLQASDGSPREAARLRPPKGERTRIACLSAGELGLSFGRERAIHGALAAGGLTDRIVEEAARLGGLRGSAGGPSAARSPEGTRRTDERD